MTSSLLPQAIESALGQIAIQQSNDRTTVLTVDKLAVALVNTGDDVVQDVCFQLRQGEILGLVGESGSGKSTVASALLGYARYGAKIIQGHIRVVGHDIRQLNEKALRAIRGKVISYVPQDPATALNPALRIGKQLQEVLQVHEPALALVAREQRIHAVLREVGLPVHTEFLNRFPHQLSGGQQQRVLLALAFVLQPKVIVLDEPTTALDVSTQTLVLNIIRQFCRQHGVAAVYVSHDLAVVKDLVDRVIVLYAGRIVEDAPLVALFEQAHHPYSQGLLAAIPDVAQRRQLAPIKGQAPAPGTRPQGCAFASRCPYRSELCAQVAPALLTVDATITGSQVHRVACYHQQLQGQGDHQDRITVPADDELALQNTAAAGRQANVLFAASHINAWYGPQQALFDVSLQLEQGQCLALVGESGSGKTTLSRILAGLNDQASGQVLFAGQPLSLNVRQRSELARREIQYVFQNPYRALNPSLTVGQTLTTALRHFFPLSRQQAREQALQVLAKVSLQPKVFDALPRELSGGERQRVALARALVCQPKVLICDEITSALDVSVQASILLLLQQLQAQGLSILFVTHNLGVVRAIADSVVVLRHGQIVEQGDTAQVLDHPIHPYTQQLIAHAPSLFKPAVVDTQQAVPLISR